MKRLINKPDFVRQKFDVKNILKGDQGDLVQSILKPYGWESLGFDLKARGPGRVYSGRPLPGLPRCRLVTL